jgi:NitT/TauT family transport system substrate-binding protein
MNNSFSRRRVLTTGAAFAGALAMPAIVSNRVLAQSGTKTVNMQLGWLASGGQLGEVAAKHLGYFEEEGIDLAIQPGGPSIDGVAIVASGRYEIGQVSSSPSLMLAASQDIPVKCFGVLAQEHPYAFFSKQSAPIEKPQDMVGKSVGIQGTGRPLINALLKANDIPQDQVEIVVIGSDMSPLATGQVDAISGWVTNTTALGALPEKPVAMRIWNHGVQLYAYPYYATHETLQNNAEMLAGFLRATAKGWAYAHENTEAAVDLLVKEYTNLVKEDELVAAKIFLDFVFTDATAQNGWGTFDPAIWERQITLYSELGEFSAGAPELDEVITTAILEATAEARPKIG